MRTAVIGGGIAGISAASRLYRAGVDFDLFEASKSLGGRARAIVFDRSIPINYGEKLVSKSYSNFLELIQFLNSNDKLFFQKRLKVNYVFQDGRQDSLSFQGLFGALSGFLNFKSLSLTSKFGILKAINCIKRNKTFSARNADDFLRITKQSADSKKIFWEPLIIAVFNSSPINVEINSLFKTLKKGFFGKIEDSSLGMFKTPIGSILNTFNEKIQESDSKIILESNIEEIAMRDDRIILRASNCPPISYDSLIIAVPPDRLSKLLKNSSALSFKSDLSYVSRSPIISVYFEFDKAIFNEDFFAFIDAKSQWIFNLKSYSNESFFYEITISDARELFKIKEKELIEALLLEIRKYFKSAKEAKLLNWKMIKEQNATWSATVPIETNLSKSIILAGDWTCQELPATMESAALSGKIAAESIIKNSERSKKFI